MSVRCLDSTFLIDLLKGDEAAAAKMREIETLGEGVSLPAPCLAEVLLGTGLVLIVVGFIATLWVKAPELLLSLVLGINVLAVLCVAAGILLLPERTTPSPADASAAGDRGGFRLGRVRFRLSLPHVHLRHARH